MKEYEVSFTMPATVRFTVKVPAESQQEAIVTGHDLVLKAQPPELAIIAALADQAMFEGVTLIATETLFDAPSAPEAQPAPVPETIRMVVGTDKTALLQGRFIEVEDLLTDTDMRSAKRRALDRFNAAPVAGCVALVKGHRNWPQFQTAVRDKQVTWLNWLER